MKQTTDNKNLEKFIKWSKICIITAITAFLVFGVGAFLLTILKEFTALEEKVPFLYSKIFAGILIAVSLVIVALEIFCCVKMRKYKKSIEQNSENDDQLCEENE